MKKDRVRILQAYENMSINDNYSSQFFNGGANSEQYTELKNRNLNSKGRNELS